MMNATLTLSDKRLRFDSVATNISLQIQFVKWPGMQTPFFGCSPGPRVPSTSIFIQLKSTFHIYSISHLDLGDGEEEGTLLDNSAAKHKMAVRPQRKRRSESRNRDSLEGSGLNIAECIADDGVKKVKSSKDDGQQQKTYRRTRSGRHPGVDPAAKRE